MIARPVPNHVYQGDAMPLLSSWPSGFADLLLTDPPYGNNSAYGRGRRRIVGDEHPLVGLSVVAASYRLLKRDATAYVFCAASHIGFMEHFFLRYSPFRVREILVWDKKNAGFGNVFRRAYECIMVLEKGKPDYRVKSLPTLLHESRVSAKAHPHAKPVPLLERLIDASSDPGGLVLDPFAGSGSTGVAAARLGREFVGVEIDPGYAQIASERLEVALAEHADPPSAPAA